MAGLLQPLQSAYTMANLRDCVRSSPRWAIISFAAILLVLGGALYVVRRPDPYRTFTSPNLVSGRALHVEYPPDWRIDQRAAPHDGVRLIPRVPTGVSAWIDEHFFRKSAANWKECSIEIVWGHSEISDLDAFASNVELHPVDIFGRGVVETRRASCEIGPLFEVVHRIGRLPNAPERRDCYIVPPTSPGITVFCFTSGTLKRATYQAGDNIVRRLRFVSVHPSNASRTGR